MKKIKAIKIKIIQRKVRMKKNQKIEVMIKVKVKVDHLEVILNLNHPKIKVIRVNLKIILIVKIMMKKMIELLSSRWSR